ncbi:MAG: signal recognition particle protein [Deltaproteobacteria bacterium]|nr:signal recognition particle protein [Deltaproteobacteria bacterium]
MLETVTRGFKNARLKLQGKAELNSELVDEALKDIRVSLLEADVDLGVVKSFMDRVRDKSLGQVVGLEVKDGHGKRVKLSPQDRFNGICHEELEALMGPVDTSITVQKPLTKVMMVGLQGSGKTTTAGKLARWLDGKKLRPLLVAADIYRPAAVDQLRALGDKLQMPVFHEPGLKPPELCEKAMAVARETGRNAVIFDTAGRLAIDEELMRELEDIKARTKPDNIFLVVDSMIGQDAVRTAAEFNRRLDLTGFIMTKLDGDARGGAALSIKEVTGKPIKFLGVGETLDKLEEFRPQGLASRILGLGDIVGLIKDFEEVVDEDKAEKDALRMMRGQFNLVDFLEQVKTLKKMGSLKELVEKIPFMSEAVPEGQQVDDKELVKFESIVHSMTVDERRKPDLIDTSRKRRIARGSGRTPKDVDDLLGRFKMMKQMMQALGQNAGFLNRIPGFKQLGAMRGMPGGPDMKQLFGGVDPFAGTNRPLAPPPGYYATTSVGASRKGGSDKDKKAKRKAEKAARKKARKR